jgi:outer membrane protein OmpA-like peptidoglycan-associated protein
VSTGIYRSNLAANQSFVITAYARGYATFTETIDLSKLAVNGKLNKDIYLNPLAVGDKITLQNINFELSKSDLLPASFVELDKVVTMMKDFPQMEIRLEGHTDVVGDPDANQELSEERVESCKNYLVKKGIAPARIQTIGYGSSKPIIKSGTEEQRKVNRRVEMSVLKM